MWNASIPLAPPRRQIAATSLAEVLDAGRGVAYSLPMTNYRPEAFADWYAQVTNAADIDITELMTAFNEGVTPEEMNTRKGA